jgi:hypothetical protein
MKKRVINILVLVSIISLFFTFIPNVFSQTENVEVLSYSYYPVVISDTPFIYVVGEVQNVGPNIIEQIYLGAEIYTKDGKDQAVSYTWVYPRYILPQQKAPFAMYFYNENSYSGDFNWYPIGIDYIDFGIVEANQTDYYQYPDLEITTDAGYIDQSIYTVEGTIRNNGDQAAGRLWVVATFYNASGDVIAVGNSGYLTPDSLPSGPQTTSFGISPIDYTQQLATEITDYSLLIQTEGPIIPEFPSFLILPLFMVATLLVVVVYRRKLMKRASE